MKTRIRKLFPVWSLDKEEQWVNEMMAQGKQLSSFGIGRYDFVDGTPGEYIFRVEMLAKSVKHAESKKYIQFVEDTGAEYIGNCTMKVYFRKKAEKGGFDLYSGIDSQIKYLSRLIVMLSIFSAAGILIGLPYIISSFLVKEYMYLYLLSGIMDISAGLFIGFGVFKVISRKRKLQKEKILHE